MHRCAELCSNLAETRAEYLGHWQSAMESARHAMEDKGIQWSTKTPATSTLHCAGEEFYFFSLFDGLLRSNLDAIRQWLRRVAPLQFKSRLNVGVLEWHFDLRGLDSVDDAELVSLLLALFPLALVLTPT